MDIVAVVAAPSVKCLFLLYSSSGYSSSRYSSSSSSTFFREEMSLTLGSVDAVVIIYAVVIII